VFLLACNLATPCIGHEPKARVATKAPIGKNIKVINLQLEFKFETNQAITS
jgi:hypothetical protein